MSHDYSVVKGKVAIDPETNTLSLTLSLAPDSQPDSNEIKTPVGFVVPFNTKWTS